MLHLFMLSAGQLEVEITRKLFPNRHLRFFVKFFFMATSLFQPLFDNKKETHSQLTALLTNYALTYYHFLFLIPSGGFPLRELVATLAAPPRDQKPRYLLGFCRDELGQR
jgi:hypothetical protein